MISMVWQAYPQHLGSVGVASLIFMSWAAEHKPETCIALIDRCYSMLHDDVIRWLLYHLVGEPYALITAASPAHICYLGFFSGVP